MQSQQSNRSVLASTGDTKFLPELAERLQHSNVSVIKEMMYLGAQETDRGKNIVSLGVGLPFYKAPEHVHTHVISVLHTKPDIDKYTLLTGLPALRKMIANVSTEELGFPVTEEEILITPGSMAALLYSMLALVNPGDEVLLPSPYFSSYGEQVAIASGKAVPVPMIEDEKVGFRLDIKKIEQAITKRTKAIILNNPQNPTGAVFLKGDLLALADLLARHKIYVVTDEVYEYLVYDEAEYFNIATVLKLWPRVIRCCSFSKKYGMMGWRVGYVHTRKDLLMHMLKVHDANIVCAPHISQEAAIAALSGPQEIVAQYHEWLSENRSVICKRLDELPDLFTYVKPRGTYYVFPKYNLPISSIEMAKRLLFEAGVVTVPGVGFGPEGEQHLRLSFGSSIKDINTAFDRISAWWNVKKQSF